MSKEPQKSLSQDKQIESFEEVKDFNNPDFEFIPKSQHKWVQQGPYLICRSCDLQHAVPIGMERVLMGFKDNGDPIIKKRSEVGL